MKLKKGDQVTKGRNKTIGTITKVSGNNVLVLWEDCGWDVVENISKLKKI